MTGPPQALPRTFLRLIPVGDDELGMRMEAAGTLVAADGTFVFANVPSGTYVIRTTPTVGDATFGSAPAPPFPSFFNAANGLGQPDGLSLIFRFREEDVIEGGVTVRRPIDAYWGEAQVTISEREISDISAVVNLHRAVKLSGTNSADGEGPSSRTIAAEPADGNPARGRPLAQADAAGRFVLDGLLPGQYFIRTPTATVKSIMWMGRDYADGPFEIIQGSDLDNVEIVTTGKSGLVRGVVAAADGSPYPRAIVVYFPTESRGWQDYGIVSPRLGRVLTSSSAGYRIPGLPAGEYFIVAVDVEDTRTGPWQAPAFLRAAAPLATRVRLGWGEERVVALRIQPVNAR